MFFKYNYEEGRIVDRYENRIDRGDPLNGWEPKVKIHFSTWIDGSQSEIFTDWCDKFCKKRYFSPKVWWFMFESKDDFVAFIKAFYLQLPTLHPRAKDLSSKNTFEIEIDQRDGLFNDIVTWCYNNIDGEWGTGESYKEGIGKSFDMYMIIFHFITETDAMAFKLRWI